MNIRSFANYKIKCPLCHSNLNIGFHTKARSYFSISEPSNANIIELSKTIKDKALRVRRVIHLSIDKFTNEFEVYYKVNGKKIDLSKQSREQFQEVDKNFGPYFFVNSCNDCDYFFGSNDIKFNFDSCKITDVNPVKEFCHISKWTDDDNNVMFKIHNNLITNTSNIYMISDGNRPITMYSEIQVYSANQLKIPLQMKMDLINENDMFSNLKKMANFA